MEYSTEILSLIQSLELQRIAIFEKLIWVALFIVLINFIVYFKFSSNFLPVLVVSFFAMIGSYLFFNSMYKRQVERDLLPKLVKSIDSDFEYLKSSDLDVEDINSLKFFSHKIANIQSDGSIKIEQNNKRATLSFASLESVKTDTEEGEHETLRFDGAIVVVEFPKDFNQTYLLQDKNSSKVVEFEAGDYLNPKNMGLKEVKKVSDSLLLYSQNGNSSLSLDTINKVLEFKEDLNGNCWAIFDKNRLYIFADTIKGGFGLSLFKKIEELYFVANYRQLLKRVKALVN